MKYFKKLTSDSADRPTHADTIYISYESVDTYAVEAADAVDTSMIDIGTRVLVKRAFVDIQAVAWCLLNETTQTVAFIRAWRVVTHRIRPAHIQPAFVNVFELKNNKFFQFDNVSMCRQLTSAVVH